jgi:hypothetical protein
MKMTIAATTETMDRSDMTNSPAVCAESPSNRRPTNAALRTREYLTDAEIARLTKAANGNR